MSAKRKKTTTPKAGRKRRRRPESGSRPDWLTWWKGQWDKFKKGVAVGVDLANPGPGVAFDDREWHVGARYAEALDIIADRASKYLGRVSAGEDPVEALGDKKPAPGKN